MITSNEEYSRILDLTDNIDSQNVNNLSIDDLRLIAIFQKYQVDILREDNLELKKKLLSKNKSSKNSVFTEVPDFVAIDFETATTDRMACSLGIIVVNDYKISQEFYYLIQPPNNKFDQNCINIHKIHPAHTVQQPTFDKVWQSVRHHFNKIIVTHNAAFDLDVLNINCRYYGITEPDINAICTCVLHNKIRLEDACTLYDIPIYNHHNALEDARACANLFIKYQKIHRVTCLIDKPATKTQKEKNEDFFSDPGRRLSKDVLKQDLSTVENKDNIFYNKKVVITGVFNSYPVREDLANHLKRLGADINTSISSKTDIVICGNEFGPAKIRKVKELQDAGFDIKILNEEMLKNIEF